ncbi:MAG: 3-oxoacyl-[acyl-carrier-protein] synthase III C-terminal domain-containing protein [Pseudomonadota bacterium]|nr:3-oxoacyl-[acyl-carrier-protein] synthase III C-terminal domain-containing protein [Pseudomonadota bacterium]
MIDISGTGRALPAQHVPTSHFDTRLGRPEGSLFAATGVRARYVCGPESQVDLAETAARAALADAGLQPSDIDLILFGAAVPYQPIPATAPLIMQRLGLPDGTAAAFDVNATCLSFLTALDTAARMIATGQATRALVVSSEVASRALPWDTQPEVAALFGDGAAAAVVSQPTSAGIVASLMRTYPSAYDACTLGAGGTRFDYHNDPAGFAAHAWFAMDGKELFRLASRHFASFVDDLLARAGWARGDVDLVIPHQASPAALTHMIRQTGFAPDRVVDIIADHGNQIAASIPFALDVARRAGRMPTGTRTLFLGTSAGVSFGGMAYVA